MVAALVPYAVVVAILGVLVMAMPIVGVLTTAAAVAVAVSGRSRR